MLLTKVFRIIKNGLSNNLPINWLIKSGIPSINKNIKSLYLHILSIYLQNKW